MEKIKLIPNTMSFSDAVDLPIKASFIMGRQEGYLKQVQIKQLKDKIVLFLKTHKNAFISDIAEELDISPDKVFNAVMELRDEGVIRDSK